MKQDKSTLPSYSRVLILPCTALKAWFQFATKKGQYFLRQILFYLKKNGSSPVTPVLQFVSNMLMTPSPSLAATIISPSRSKNQRSFPSSTLEIRTLTTPTPYRDACMSNFN